MFLIGIFPGMSRRHSFPLKDQPYDYLAMLLLELTPAVIGDAVMSAGIADC